MNYKLSAVAIALSATSMISNANNFQIKSPTIEHYSMFSEVHALNGFGCNGKNISPALQWTAGPTGTKSYAVTIFDIDAPTGTGWWHWVVYNIPSNVTELVAGAGEASGGKLPFGAVQGRTDFGTHGFGGACPPEGARPHRYIFTVYALKTEKIDAPPDASAALIGFRLNANALNKASFTARYSR